MDEEHRMHVIYPDMGLRSQSEFPNIQAYLAYLREMISFPDPKRNDDTQWHYSLRWKSHVDLRVKARIEFEKISKQLNRKKQGTDRRRFQFRSRTREVYPQNIFWS